VGRDMTENHKFINLALLIGSVLSAGCISRLVEKRGKVGIVLSIAALVLLSISGVIDLMVIKNDFQYPVADFGASPFMRWIRDETRPDSIFLSYRDIFDPVTLSGRKTYFGFFGAKAYPRRALAVKAVYEATPSSFLPALSQTQADYLVLPKWKKDDFSSSVSLRYLRSELAVVYEDERHIVFRASDLIE